MSLRSLSFSVLFIVASIAGRAYPAAALPITITFQGVVDDFRDPNGLTDGSVGVGTPFEAVLTYDPSAPTFVINSSPTFLDVGYVAPPTQFSMRIGPWTVGVGAIDALFPENGDGVRLMMSQGGSDSVRWSTSAWFVEGLDIPIAQYQESVAGVSLVGPAGSLPSLSPDEIPLNPSDWAYARAGLNLLPVGGIPGINDILANGPITSIQVVPEGATALSLGAGLFFLGLNRRGRNCD